MDFENAYKKYKDGVATDEETAFVEQELEKARKMTEFIDAYESKKAISDDCDEDKIRRAQKKYAKKKYAQNLVDFDCGAFCVRRNNHKRGVRHCVRLCKQKPQLFPNASRANRT